MARLSTAFDPRGTPATGFGSASGLVGEVLVASPVATFVIDANHVVTHWNAACESMTGVRRDEVVGTRDHWRPFYAAPRPTLADLLLDGAEPAVLSRYYPGRHRASFLVPDALEAEGLFERLAFGGRWLIVTAAPLRDAGGRTVAAIETLQDITAHRVAEETLRRSHDELDMLVQRRTAELKRAMGELQADIERRQEMERELMLRYDEMARLNERLTQAQEQLLQSEKMASVGQLAAGVAHEINNPIGYVHSNLGRLDGYAAGLMRVLAAYEGAQAAFAPADGEAIAREREAADLDFLKEDIPALLRETREGVDRVRRIVQDLKDFSRADGSQEWQWANLHHGLDSTLNIVTNEIKYRADLVKAYGEIPDIECLPSQLNQVFMNLLVNAAQAIEGPRGAITVRTGAGAGEVWVEVADTGKGIPEENLKRIFDPFFTTKPVGKGTGLGLSLSYGIVQKHGGRIDVTSRVGAGTTFRVILPVRRDGACTDGSAG